MAPDLEHEAAFIRAFIAPTKRERLVELLGKPKRRRDVLSTLYHFADLDPRFIRSIPAAEDMRKVSRLSSGQRALRTCATARADLVFFGEVLEQTTYVEYTERGPLLNGIQAVRFNVIRAFKGVKPSQWWWGLFYFGVEAKSFKHGARYLVFAHRSATGAFHAGSCTLTREMERADEEAWLRTGAVELGACFNTRR
jgi:hypothetical protein